MKRAALSALVALVVISFAVPAAAQLASSAWPMFRHDARHTGLSAFGGPRDPILS